MRSSERQDGARAPGEEVPLIEAQDPSLIDQQEGPVVTPLLASGPDESPRPANNPGPRPG